MPLMAMHRRLVDRLMAACDTLAAQFARRQATGRALLDAVLHAAQAVRAAPGLIEA